MDILLHIKENLNCELDDIKKYLKYIESIRDNVHDFVYNEYKKEFKCPIGLSDYDAICPQCDKVLPIIVDIINEKKLNVHTFYWPYNMTESLKDDTKKEGCMEWKKKDKISACGCSGTEYCVCGYNLAYCFPREDESGICPFCGRELSTKRFRGVVFNS